MEIDADDKWAVGVYMYKSVLKVNNFCCSVYNFSKYIIIHSLHRVLLQASVNLPLDNLRDTQSALSEH